MRLSGRGKIQTLLLVQILFQTAYSQQYSGDVCTVNGQGRGICQLERNCPEARRQFQFSNIRPTICGFDGNQPIVCCISSNSQPRPNSNNNFNGFNSNSNGNSGNSGFVSIRDIENKPSVVSTTRISERKCEEYSSRVIAVIEALPLLPDPDPLSFKVAKCDYTSTPLIVGGEEVEVGEFPYMAVIGWPLINGRGYAWNCGGTLISENFVLTAAHCTSLDRDTSVSSREPTVVRLGEHNLVKNDDGADPQDIAVDSIIRHPEHRPPSKYHDIALIKLVQAVRMGDKVRPSCLWQTPRITATSAIATGWGRIDFAENQSDVLLKVSLKLIDQSTCSSLYTDRGRKLRRGIIDEQLCAGDLDGGHDTCQGDSGGPLQISQSANRCIFYVVGITSFGTGCGGKNTPAVYTRVSSYIDWIEGVVWPSG